MFTSPIVPAIIPQSPDSVADFLASLPTAPELHLDVVDGQFVPFVSWPYEPVGNPSAVAATCESRTLEVDLMVHEPLKAARAWMNAGADMLVFHIETITPEALQQFAIESVITIGVSASNTTPHEALLPYLEAADYVQVMGIADIGVQGQPFDERAIERIAWLRSINRDIVISIDGSVNASTLPQLVSCQLQRYIVGSAIVQAEQPNVAYHEFSKLALQQVKTD